MIPREEILWRLEQCLSIQASTPIHLNHQLEALPRYGLSDQAKAELAEGVRQWMEAAHEHAASITRLREFLLTGRGNV